MLRQILLDGVNVSEMLSDTPSSYDIVKAVRTIEQTIMTSIQMVSVDTEMENRYAPRVQIVKYVSHQLAPHQTTLYMKNGQVVNRYNLEQPHLPS